MKEMDNDEYDGDDGGGEHEEEKKPRIAGTLGSDGC
jgi:hypothetical protein